MLAVAVGGCYVQWQRSRWIKTDNTTAYLIFNPSKCFCLSLLGSDQGARFTLPGASQAMLYAAGLQEEDMQKPQVGLVLN